MIESSLKNVGMKKVKKLNVNRDKKNHKMKKIIAFFCLLLSTACVTENHQPHTIHEALKADNKTVDESFDIKFQLDKMDSQHYLLDVAIELFNGSYVVSPYSKDTTYGHFEISIKDTERLIMGDALLERPNSVAEFDPILNELVRFVRENTTYTQRIKVLAKGDFEVSGLVWFVLEPSCMPYEVRFVISSHSGEMQIKKTSTKMTFKG